MNRSLNKTKPTLQRFVKAVTPKNVGKFNFRTISGKNAFYHIHSTTNIPKCPPATIAFNTPGSPPPNLKTQKTLSVAKRKLIFISQTNLGLRLNWQTIASGSVPKFDPLS